MKKWILLENKVFYDEKRGGGLSVLECGNKVSPFLNLRTFVIVYNNPNIKDGDMVRGNHAHKICEQFFCCLRGSVSISCFDGTVKEEILLNSQDKVLVTKSMVFHNLKFSNDAVVMVGNSHLYDPWDYIHSEKEFIDICNKLKSSLTYKILFLLNNKIHKYVRIIKKLLKQ